MGDFSPILFARPSATEGVGRLFDFGNVLDEYNTSLTPEQADRLALRSDWRQVGRDIAESISHFDEAASRQSRRP